MNNSKMFLRARLAAGASSVAVGLAVMLSAGVACAQDAASAEGKAEELDAIVVTGFRASLQSAISQKRDAAVIAEAFSAEDIGKLPDTSIAETLARLPGLATQRLDGRSQVVSIRGLGPDFSNTLLNGREQVSSSDNRNIEFDQYPSELINSGLVYKTPFAGLIGQGLAGTVDLRTIRPLDKNDRVISVAARYEFNGKDSLNPDLSNKGFRATATYVDQFLDNTLGVSIGVAYQSSPQQVEEFSPWGYPNATNTGYNGELVIGGTKPFVRTVDLDRFGVTGTLEYKPIENFSSTLDLYYSKFTENQRLRGIEIPLYWSAAQLQPGGTIEDGFVTAGTYTNVTGVVRNDANGRDTDTYAAGWRNVYETDGWKFDLDLNYSRSDRQQRNLESYSGTGYATSGPDDTIGFQVGSGGLYNLTSQLDYTDTNLIVLTDPQGWGAGNNLVQAGFVNAPNTEDELKQVRLEVTKDIGWSFLKSVVAGFNYSDRSKERVFQQNFLTLAGNGISLANGAVRELPIPTEALLGSTTGLNFLGLGDQVTYDPFYLIENGIYTLVPVALSSVGVPQDWRVEENVSTGWVRADLDGHLGETPFTGNIGVQIVYTDQSSNGFRVVNQPNVAAGTLDPVFVPNEVGAKYTYFLPSFNLNFKVTPETQVRLGFARTLARARLDQLNASLSPTINRTRLPVTDPNLSAFSASGGNGALRPYIADGVDLSVEHYFAGNRGYVSGAFFYKKLRNYVNPNDSFLTDFSYLVPELTPAEQAILGTTLGVTSGPTNNGEGKLYGFEGTVSLPFEILHPWLEGLGFTSSASYTFSSVRLGDNPEPITVPGLSDWVVNSTLYFERWGFESRLSHRYRSAFLAEVSGISTTRVLRTALEESIFDAQVGYRFKEGALEGLNLTFQGLNLTDRPFINFENEDERRVRQVEYYGRTFLAGISYSF
ncbi:MAG: TonB-dependent receptor [Sphingomonadales bacterium]|nr:MAG: TonB-dependent receptor [Sphingomonadales bacterium]